jgi:signal transduction histidine kinase/CheY-like chemotaxis protein
MQDEEDELLRSVALRNAQTILAARQRAEEELRATKETLEERTRVLEILNATGTTLASKRGLEELVQAVTDAGTLAAGAQFGAFFYTVPAPDSGTWLLYTLSGAPRSAFDGFGQPRDTPVFAPTFAGKGVIRSGNIRKDPRYGTMAPHHGMPMGHLPVCSYLAVPVVLRSGDVIGGLFFGHSDEDVFNEGAERIVVGIAAQASTAIENVRLFDEAHRAVGAERAARTEVERVSLMKDEFLATLSHELRTPLNAVLGWSEMLLGRDSIDAETRRGLETIARNARAQAQMIEDLLDMNRIVSGKIRLDVQPIELAAIVDAAVDSVRPSIDAKGIRLRKTLDPVVGQVFGDPHRLQQVVWNLLSNAVKFTPKNGKIDVLLQRVNSHVEIVVTDSGIGISEEFLPHLFERFRQADSSTTRKYGGLGLGLSIVKQIVELHGGSVRADSRGPGTGAMLVVSLPVRAVRRDEPRVHPTSAVSGSRGLAQLTLAGLTLLVIDDEPDARELLAFVLREFDAEVHTAGSVDEALALLRSVKPHVIVSDIGMPDRDGYDLMRAVRALPSGDGGKTPAVAVTAFARSEDRTRALLAGYQAHIAKPIEPHELVVTIGSLTGRAGG